MELSPLRIQFIVPQPATQLPVVTYNGQVLTEGVDYTVSGAVAYSEVGTYTCYIRGIRQYTGTVVDAIPGDLDGNETVNEDDAIYLLQYVLMPDLFPIT